MGNASAQLVAPAALPFDVRFSDNFRGDIAAIGNVSATCQGSTGGLTCANVQNYATYTSSGSTVYNNNAWKTSGLWTRVNIDPSAGYLDSSSAELRIPAGAIIRNAQLFWFGYVERFNVEANVPAYIRLPGGSSSEYHTVVADQITVAPDTDAAPTFGGMLARADVTDLIRQGGQATILSLMLRDRPMNLHRLVLAWAGR